MRRTVLLGLGIALGLALTARPAPAVTVHFTDFIPDGSRTNFNGFEGYLDPGGPGGSGAPTYTEDGIAVDQVGGQGNDIWSTCGVCFGGTLDGALAWYPNGGDLGYTRITRVGGVDFDSVGFRTGSGFGIGPITVYYELWNDGALILQGNYPSVGVQAGYLGFSGGGFDEIRLRDSILANDSIGSGTLNAFAVDSIELAGPGEPVPEPAAVLLLGTGLLGLAARRRAR